MCAHKYLFSPTFAIRLYATILAVYQGKQSSSSCKMPYVDPEFVVPTVPEDEMYEGTEIDKNVLGGKY